MSDRLSGSPQLPLALSLSDHATFANFHAAANGPLLELLRDGREPIIFIWGEGGSGKSHLLQAACHESDGQGSPAAYLPLRDLAVYPPDLLEGLEQMAVVCLDDVEAIAGNRLWEEALFHLINRVRAADHRLIVAASAAPPAIGLGLPDLASRLGWGPVFRLQSLNDEEKQRALQQRAQNRGLVLDDEVAVYLLRHFARDPHRLFDLLDTLDQASLAAQRRLTIPFVREALKRYPG